MMGDAAARLALARRRAPPGQPGGARARLVRARAQCLGLRSRACAGATRSPHGWPAPGPAGLVSARGGDAVRVLLLRRRMRRGGMPAAGRNARRRGRGGGRAVGALLLALALAVGVGPQLRARVVRRPWPRRPRARRRWSRWSRSRAASPRRAPDRGGRRPGLRAAARGRAPTRAPRCRGRSRAARCWLGSLGVLPRRVRRARLGGGGAGPSHWRRAAAGWSRSRPPRSGAEVRRAAGRELRPGHGSAVSAQRLAAFLVGTSTVLTMLPAARSRSRSACAVRPRRSGSERLGVDGGPAHGRPPGHRADAVAEHARDESGGDVETSGCRSQRRRGGSSLGPRAARASPRAGCARRPRRRCRRRPRSRTAGSA